MKYCILLTACVNPAGMKHTMLQDFQLRRKQYIEAIWYYLRLKVAKIVFVENSNFDLSPIFSKEIQNGQIEMFTFDGNHFDHNLGKGYGESEIMEYAFRHSCFIKNAEYVIKITGRIILDNIRLLLFDFRVWGHYDVVASYICKGLMDSRIVIAKSTFWRDDFLLHREKLNDSKGVYFEHLLEECCQKKNWRPFLLALPVFEGLSGTFGTNIEHMSSKSRRYWQIMKVNWVYFLKK